MSNQPPDEVPQSGPLRGDDLTLLEQVRDVPIPFPKKDYLCPSCEQPIPTRRQIRFGKPPRFEHLLNDVQKCPWCNYLFSYATVTAHVITG